MKKKYLLFACVILGVAFAGMPCWARQSVSGSVGDVLTGDLRDTLRRQLEDYRACRGETGVVSCAKNEVQALKMLESCITPTLDDCSEARIGRLKGSVVTGKTWIYQVVSGDWRICYLLDLFPCSTPMGYGFHYIVSCRNNQTGAFDPPHENHGLLQLLSSGFAPDKAGELPAAYEEYCQRLPRLKDALPKRGETYQYVVDDPMDTLAIVDVVDVELLCVDGFDYHRRHITSLEGCSALYRIRLDVREVVRGILPSDVLILETKQPWSAFRWNGEWVFYRGMTLRISVHREKGDILLVDAVPVEPYPPYSNDNVRISSGALVGGFRARESEGRIEPLVVEYGTHTKVEFQCGDIITMGNRASFADFGVTSKFKILELKEGSNRKYWENAWFNPGGSGVDFWFIGVFSGELTSCCLRNSDPCGSRYRSAECA